MMCCRKRKLGQDDYYGPGSDYGNYYGYDQHYGAPIGYLHTSGITNGTGYSGYPNGYYGNSDPNLQYNVSHPAVNWVNVVCIRFCFIM